MTEEEARVLIERRWGAGAVDRLDRFAALLIDENQSQNLVAPASIPHMWVRHLLDSAQLMLHTADVGHWVDIGTGAGLPGIIVASVRDGPVTMIEPRRRRADFLRDVVDALGLRNAVVIQASAQSAKVAPASVVSARAVAGIDALFDMSRGFTLAATTYILPRGRIGDEEVVSIASRWHGVFHVEQSITSAGSMILVATGVAPRCSVSP